MRYVDAGYIVALSVLAAYAVGLVLRRRRLVRAAAMSSSTPPASPSTPPAKTSPSLAEREVAGSVLASSVSEHRATAAPARPRAAGSAGAADPSGS